MPCNFLERGLQLNGLRLSCVSDTNSQHNHGHHITNMPCNFLERGLQVNGLRLSCVCDTVKSTNPQISRVSYQEVVDQRKFAKPQQIPNLSLKMK